MGWERQEAPQEEGRLEKDHRPREKPQLVQPTERVENDTNAHQHSWVMRGKNCGHEEVLPPEIRKKEDDRPDCRKITTTMWRERESLHLRKEPAPKTRWRNCCP